MDTICDKMPFFFQTQHRFLYKKILFLYMFTQYCQPTNQVTFKQKIKGQLCYCQKTPSKVVKC